MVEEQKTTGYPSIDKPWLKYYSEEAINAPLPECSIYEYLWENNKEHLDDIAINYFDKKISYRKLFDNIKKTAKAFAAIGVSSGDIVVLATITLPETIYAFYALNRLGAISNMVDPRTSAEGMKEYLLEVNCKIVLSLDMAYEKMQEACVGTNVERIILLSPSDSLPFIKNIFYRLKNPSIQPNEQCILWKQFISNGIEEIPAHKTDGKTSCCVIVHTGGTTGTPKGVMLSDYNLNATVVQCDLSGFCLRKGHRWLGIMPPFIAYGIANGLHLPLCIGMVLIIIPAFDPQKYDDLLLKYKPSYIVGVPSHYGNVIHSKKMKKADFSGLFYPVVGGDGVEVGFEKEINSFLRKHHCSTNLIKGYGMTEICAAVCTTSRMEYNKLGSVGIPFTHSVLSIFDPETGEESGYHTTGEVCMQGPHVMLGYYNNPEETEQILRTHKDGSVWLHSGDIGYMDEDGCVYILDRMKRMIVRHDGFKVFPTLIESTVSQLREVERCCAVGIPDVSHSQGQQPVVYIQLKPDSMTDETTIKKELVDLCEKELPEYAQPVEWYFIAQLPLTPIGKVDYRALEQLAQKTQS